MEKTRGKIRTKILAAVLLLLTAAACVGCGRGGEAAEGETTELFAGAYNMSPAGVLRFDGTNIKNERNFENGCTDMTIPPKDLSVCVLRGKNDHSIVFSRFEIIKYMMARVQPEQISYYGAKYDGAPDFEKATFRIREKVRMYYEKHQAEIREYDTEAYQFVLYGLGDFVKEFI